MNKKLPLLLLGSFSLLLAGCGSESGTSTNLVSGSNLKYNKANILAYNVVEDTSKITKANLEESKLKTLVDGGKVEVTSAIENPDGSVGFYIVKDLVTESETVNKFGIYSISDDKLIVPYKFETSESIKTYHATHNRHKFKLFSGTVKEDTEVYDNFGNLIFTVKGKTATVKNVTFEDVYGGDVDFAFKVTMSTSDFTTGHYVDKKYVEGVPTKGTSETLKPDDFVTGERMPLDLFNLPDYEGAILGHTFQVFKGNELVKSYRLPFDPSSETITSVPLNGYMFYQESIKVPDDETNYTYFTSELDKTSKYITRTHKLNILTGVNEQVDFPYLMDAEANSTGENKLLKDSEGKLTYGQLFGRVIYKDKTLSDKVGYAFNNKLEVINDYTDVNFDKLIKLDKGIFDASTESQIFYNDKEEPVFKLADARLDSSVGALKIFAKENRFLVKTKNEDNALVVDTNGQVIKLFANAHTFYTNSLNNQVFLFNEAGNIMTLIDLSEIKDNKDIVSYHVSDLGLNNSDSYLIHYKTTTENVITDFFGHSFSFSTETYPDFSLAIETLDNSNASITVKNGEAIIAHYRIDLGL